MQKLPEPGTEVALHATFRLILKDQSSSSSLSSLADSIGKSVMLEPIDLPGMNVVHQGANQPLIINSHGGPSSVFLVAPGLDGRKGSISLESQSNKGCYVYNGVRSGSGVKLSCISGSAATFKQAASFVLGKGLRQYDLISFVAKGTNKNFLLEPLLSFRDEHYTAYFNIQH